MRINWERSFIAFVSVFNLNVLSPPSCLKIRSHNNIKGFTKSDKTLIEAIGMTSVLLCLHSDQQPFKWILCTTGNLYIINQFNVKFYV